MLQKIYRKMRLSVFFLYIFTEHLQERYRKDTGNLEEIVEILQKINRNFAKFLQKRHK